MKFGQISIHNISQVSIHNHILVRFSMTLFSAEADDWCMTVDGFLYDVQGKLQCPKQRVGKIWMSPVKLSPWMSKELKKYLDGMPEVQAILGPLRKEIGPVLAER